MVGDKLAGEWACDQRRRYDDVRIGASRSLDGAVEGNRVYVAIGEGEACGRAAIGRVAKVGKWGIESRVEGQEMAVVNAALQL